jgi:hypothetical protein
VSGETSKEVGAGMVYRRSGRWTAKLTQAPGAKPTAKPGPGEIDWHITLKGDAVVTGTEASGNSASVTCLVPPPPK